MDDSHGETSLRPGTLVIHGGQHPEPITGAVMPPIFTSATFAQASPGQHKGFEYSRSHNPTRYALERMCAALEGSPITEEQDPSRGAFAFSSGLAAMGTALEMLDAGDRVVAMDDLYGGSRRQLSRVRARSQGLDVEFVDMTDLDRFDAAMTAETKMLWVETPTNPLLKMVDLAAVAKRAREKNPDVILVCDNTFASPVQQRPLEFGFDIVMHSSTKYLNGHSDVVGGILVVGREDLVETMRFLQNAIGSVMGPFDSYLTLRGIFVIDGDIANARRFAESVRVFQCAESLGAVESLVNHPAIMTHASVPPEVRAELGISDSMLRLAVGVEAEADLLADLAQALDAAF